MPSVKFLLVVLTATLSVCVAAPVPWKNADYASARLDTSSQVGSTSIKTGGSSRYGINPRTVRGAPLVVSRRYTTPEYDNDVYQLNGYLESAHGYGNTLHTLALQSKSGNIAAHDPQFKRQSVDALTGFQTSIRSFQVLFKHMGRDKGLANYDRSSKLQTLLKELVNLHKDTLEAIDCLVYEWPFLGEYFGPIVYEIKCLLDLILNSLENLTDAVLNELSPLLRSCIGSYIRSTCATGFSLAGLCADAVLGAGVVGNIL